MCTNINHNYGTAVNEIPPLLAVPIVGSIRIVIKDVKDQIVGETTSNRQGEWQQTFCLDDGDYTVSFEGHFRPIGKGFTSSYLNPITSITMSIKVPLK